MNLKLSENKELLFDKEEIKSKTRKIYDNEIEIKYKINNDIDVMKIFGKKFVENIKKNFKIIYKEEEFDLNETFSIDKYERNKGFLCIKLKYNNYAYSNIFNDNESLSSLSEAPAFNSSNNIDMNFMFCDCYSLFSLTNLSKFNTSNITDTNHTFCNCTSLNFLDDISNWNTYKVTNISYLFYNCNSLIPLPDISKWNTSNVNNMSFMFCNCFNLSSLPNISSWRYFKSC